MVLNKLSICTQRLHSRLASTTFSTTCVELEGTCRQNHPNLKGLSNSWPELEWPLPVPVPVAPSSAKMLHYASSVAVAGYERIVIFLVEGFCM